MKTRAMQEIGLCVLLLASGAVLAQTPAPAAPAPAASARMGPGAGPGYGAGYQYDPDTADGFSGADYFPDGYPPPGEREPFYEPTDRGHERRIR